ncbi:MAG: hypothetical protein DRR19_27500 [Candidatus Parabeggiatoa sp. nov. 1]|nr:MAG: hypothetical protein DRR19_27500 [Gammaproteobacteria bacterium]
MMANSYTEITKQSWENNIKTSVIGILMGFVLFVGAFLLLFWNEARTVHHIQTLEEGEKIVISIDANQVEADNDGKLVHLSGETTTDETLTDPKFGVKVTNVIKLRRVVDMYQWQEKKRSELEELWGNNETVMTYIYSKTWADHFIDARKFKQPNGHRNPYDMLMTGETSIAERATLGKFTLSPSLVKHLNNYQKLNMTEEKFEQMSDKLRTQFQGKLLHLNYGEYYVGEEATQPQIGDLRIKFEIVKLTTISVVAKQDNSSLSFYVTPEVGGHIELFEYGSVSAEEMFEHAKIFNTLLTWILRAAGFLVMFIGLSMIFNALKTLSAFISFLDNLVGLVGWFISFIVATTLSFVAIAIAWIHYRPVLGTTLLVMGSVFLYFLKFARKKPPPEKPTLVPETVVPPK